MFAGVVVFVEEEGVWSTGVDPVARAAASMAALLKTDFTDDLRGVSNPVMEDTDAAPERGVVPPGAFPVKGVPTTT